MTIEMLIYGRNTARRGLALAILAGSLHGLSAAGANDGNPVQGIRALRGLSAAEARGRLPVEVTGVVLYYEPRWDTLFVHADGQGMFVFPGDAPRPRYQVGQRVRISGRTHTGPLGNSIVEQSSEILGTEPLPPSRPASYHELAGGGLDSEWIETTGVVRSMFLEFRRIEVELALDGGRLTAHLPWRSGERLRPELLHARVRFRGVASTVLNERGQPAGVRLFVPSLDEFSVVEPAVPEPFQTLPLQSLSGASATPARTGSPQRVRVQGRVTLAWPSGVVFLEDGPASLELSVAQPRKLTSAEGQVLPEMPPPVLEPGDEIEAVGYPAGRNGSFLLEEVEVRKTRSGARPAPSAISSIRDSPTNLHGRLITAEAVVVRPLAYPSGGGDAWLVRVGDSPIQVRMETGRADPSVLLPGSGVRVTGVIRVDGEMVECLLQHPQDLEWVAPPPRWWTPEVRRVVLLSFAALAAVLGWGMLVWRESRSRARQNRVLEARIQERTAELTRANDTLRREIAERSRAEAELRETESRYRRAIAVADAVPYQRDYRTESWVFMGEGIGALTGYPAAELTPQLLESRVEESQLQGELAPLPYHEAVERVRSGYPARWRRDLRILTRTGERRWIADASVEVPGPDGKPVGSIGILQDITARKTAEEHLRQAFVREKQLGELKSNFVTLVSHEFRTPLGIILSSAEILGAYFERLDPATRREHLESIQQATRRMAGLMERVLVLGQVDSERMTCRPEALDLQQFCERLTEDLTVATQARCPIRLDVAADAREVRADEVLLQHILTNLLANAVKYSEPRSPVELVVNRCNGRVRFEVRDRGVGIPDSDHARIFVSYHRGSNVGRVPGTGLGLVIVRRCVDLHGGRVQFQAREGGGTTFTVELPLGRAGAG